MADEAFVKREINSLRAVFRRELNKVLKWNDSNLTGSSAEEIYVSLWYFDLTSLTTEYESGKLDISI